MRQTKTRAIVQFSLHRPTKFEEDLICGMGWITCHSPHSGYEGNGRLSIPQMRSSSNFVLKLNCTMAQPTYTVIYFRDILAASEAGNLMQGVPGAVSTVCSYLSAPAIGNNISSLFLLSFEDDLGIIIRTNNAVRRTWQHQRLSHNDINATKCSDEQRRIWRSTVCVCAVTTSLDSVMNAFLAFVTESMKNFNPVEICVSSGRLSRDVHKRATVLFKWWLPDFSWVFRCAVDLKQLSKNTQKTLVC